MIPHTVPNRPTNGAVAPIVASTPVRFSDLPRHRRLEPLQPRGHPLLQAIAIVDRVCAQPLLGLRRRHQVAGRRPVERGRGIQRRQQAPLPPHRRRQLQALGHEHRPGQHRGQHQTHHHRLNHPVRRHEHAPHRQVLRQNRRGRRRNRGDGGGRRRGRGRGLGQSSGIRSGRGHRRRGRYRARCRLRRASRWRRRWRRGCRRCSCRRWGLRRRRRRLRPGQRWEKQKNEQQTTQHYAIP
jgi:hypothetical protein